MYKHLFSSLMFQFLIRYYKSWTILLKNGSIISFNSSLGIINFQPRLLLFQRHFQFQFLIRYYKSLKLNLVYLAYLSFNSSLGIINFMPFIFSIFSLMFQFLIRYYKSSVWYDCSVTLPCFNSSLGIINKKKLIELNKVKNVSIPH